MRYIISLLTASLALPALALPTFAEVPRVITDIPPVHSLVAQVMGDLGQPVLLLEPGADLHAFQLRPSQARDLAEADLVVWIGPGLTPWLDRALSGGTAAQVRLLEAGGTHLQPYGSDSVHDHAEHDGHDHAEDNGHANAEHDHAEHDGHDHTGTDPHAWLDPGNAAVWLPLIAADLAARDPDNAATYAANARAAIADLAALDAELAAVLRPVAGRQFVVFHDAYGYFTAHYGLPPARAIAMGDAASPSAGQLRDLQATLTPDSCVFPEANHDPALTVTLIGETGARTGLPLDPEGAVLTPGPALYADLLRRLGNDIAACLNG